jgi:hypothetical protein
MEAVAGIFQNSFKARDAYRLLRGSGFAPDHINVLVPGSPEEEIHAVPVSETEQPGMGAAMGGVIGAALGLAGGAELGAAAAASAVIPGVGPVIAVGLAGAALLGTAGAAIGSAAERESTKGLPADEIFFYEDALRQGRTVMIVIANGRAEANRARELMKAAGAESVDAAREDWWIGLRDAEQEHYAQDPQAFRTGFEAALRRECQGKTLDEAAQYLRADFPELWNSEAFRRGYDRGQLYRQRVHALKAG